MKSLIAIIVSVVVLAIVGGYLWNGNQPKNNTTTNSTNVTVNNTIDNTTSPAVNETEKSDYISGSEAIAIVKETAPAYSKVRYKSKLIKKDDDPYYQVNVYDNDPKKDSYGDNIGVAQVDAKTGEFLGGEGKPIESI